MPSFETVGINDSGTLVGRGKTSLDARYQRGEHHADVRRLGAEGLNTVNDAAFLAAQNEARTGRKENPATAGRYLGNKTINVPAGSYRITEIMGMLGKETQSININGLRFQGAGSDLTYIVFDPAVDGPLVFNDYWLNVHFEGFTFRTIRAGATFIQSYTTHAAQRYTFTDVSWSGPWKYVCDLKGNNNNSEWSFYACQTSNMADDGAFFYIGATGTSDQFLNYWWFGFKHWSTGAALIDAAKGGHFHCYGLDVSDWGGADDVKRYIFNLRGKVHAGGVQFMTVNGMRVEAKQSQAALLYSEWGEGNVTIECDWSSQANYITYGDIIHLNLDNANGPIYNFHDSNLGGGVRIQYNDAEWRKAPVVRFRDCNWLQRLTPSEVVSYQRPATFAVDPAVEFIGCRRSGATDAYAAEGASVWDATIGYSSAPLVQSPKKRQVSVRALAGNISGASSLKVNLPVGAMITGMSAMQPGGISTEADGGAWSVSTTEAAPRVIATVEVTGARSAGYNVAVDLAAPFLCSTRESATVAVTATNVSESSANAMLFIEGYW